MAQNRQRAALIIIGLFVLIAVGAILYNVFFAADGVSPAPVGQSDIAALGTPTATLAPSSTPSVTPRPSPTLSPPPTPTSSDGLASIEISQPQGTLPAQTPEVDTPPGGIIYAINPDINSVGWVQSNQATNHFGESYIYVGLRNGIEYHGAVQFDLSFIPPGSSIFFAELSLTGLVDEGLGSDGVWIVNILDQTLSEGWAGHGYDVIHNAPVDEIITPFINPADLARGITNKITLNAAQRGLIQERLEQGFGALSFRIDARQLQTESWFAWDSGFGSASLDNGPVLRLGVLVATPKPTQVTNTPTPGTPTATPTFIVVTNTPTPENVFTVAAQAATATAQATTTGTATPAPDNWVTPIVVTSTPAPQNQATAAYIAAEQTAAAIAFGTATATPQNMVTATATPVFILLDSQLPLVTATPSPTPDTRSMPPELIGKIAFLSNRAGDGEPKVFVINPDGTGFGLLTDRWPYELALKQDVFSPDGRFRTFVKDIERHPIGGRRYETETVPAVFWYDDFYQVEQQLTYFGAGIAYDSVWSPRGDLIAFVGTESGNDEIWTINSDGSDIRQLTQDEYAWWDKHPSFSPDGSQIVFWSNRTGTRQIWIMNSDGSGLYSLSDTGFDDWNPVWIKYSDPPPPIE